MPTNWSIGYLVLTASVSAPAFIAPQPHMTTKSGFSRRICSHCADWFCISFRPTGIGSRVKPCFSASTSSSGIGSLP